MVHSLWVSVANKILQFQSNMTLLFKRVIDNAVVTEYASKQLSFNFFLDIIFNILDIEDFASNEDEVEVEEFVGNGVEIPCTGKNFYPGMMYLCLTMMRLQRSKQRNKTTKMTPLARVANPSWQLALSQVPLTI